MILGLVFLFVISFVGNAPIPLPLTLTVMWLGRFDFPVTVVVVATAGSILGWIFLEGALRRWIQERPRLRNYIPAVYQRVFLRRTGFWLFFFNAFPMPFDPIRFLALLNNYGRWRFIIVLGFARLVRNISLVTIGAWLAQYKFWFWAALAVLMVLPILLEKIMRRVLARVVEADGPTLG